jgi:hypothetical protein
MSSIRDEVLRHLAHLIGRKLSVAQRAVDMRMFGFGEVSVTRSGGRRGEFALHVQCPWRIEGPQGIVTGRSDLWEPAEPSPDWDPWEDYDKEPNLQDRRIGELLGVYAPGERSYVNEGDRFVVEHVDADEFGGALLSLSGGYRLVIFPAGCTGEDWRLFGSSWPRHFVVSGGTIEQTPDEAG